MTPRAVREQYLIESTGVLMIVPPFVMIMTSSSSDTEAITAGIVLDIRYYSESSFGKIDFCIVSVKTSTGSNGSHYLLTPASINSKKVTTGIITNSVVDKSQLTNAVLPSGKLTARPEGWRSSYTIVTSADQMRQINTFANFEISQEPDQIWYLQINSDMPVLTCLIGK